MRPTFVPIALTMLVASGLAGQTARERDSAGVRIITNTRGPAAQPAFTLSPKPVCLVPAGGGRGDLTAAPSAFLLSDNRLVVANGKELRLDFYACGATATLVASKGRRGHGPGEFTSISSAFRGRGDTLLVSQTYAAPVMVFDAQGNPVTSLATRGNIMCCLENGSLLIGRPAPRTGPGKPSGFLWYRYDPRKQAEDTTPVAFLPSSETTASSRTAQRGDTRVTSVVMQPNPFGRVSSIRAYENGFVTGTGDEYAIAIHDSAGRLMRSVRVDEPARPIRAAEKARYISDQLRDLEGAERQRRESELSGVAFPNRAPPFRRIEVADRSCLWVEHYPMSDSDPGVWDLFAKTGRLLGTIQIPAGSRLMSARWPNIVLRRSNDDGFIEIAVYAVVAADPARSCQS